MTAADLLDEAAQHPELDELMKRVYGSEPSALSDADLIAAIEMERAARASWKVRD